MFKFSIGSALPIFFFFVMLFRIYFGISKMLKQACLSADRFSINLDFGDYSLGDTPLPIPNREVKTQYADGTACAGVWESR